MDVAASLGDGAAKRVFAGCKRDGARAGYNLGYHNQ
jgi:hypothetical protein